MYNAVVKILSLLQRFVKCRNLILSYRRMIVRRKETRWCGLQSCFVFWQSDRSCLHSPSIRNSQQKYLFNSEKQLQRYLLCKNRKYDKIQQFFSDWFKVNCNGIEDWIKKTNQNGRTSRWTECCHQGIEKTGKK